MEETIDMYKLVEAYNILQEKKEKNRIANRKYKKSTPGKIKNREACKRYYNKKKLEKQQNSIKST